MEFGELQQENIEKQVDAQLKRIKWAINSAIAASRINDTNEEGLLDRLIVERLTNNTFNDAVKVLYEFISHYLEEV